MKRSRVLAAILLGLLGSHRADACSCGVLLDYGLLIREATELPRNAKGLVWIGSSPAGLEHFEVIRVVDDSETRAPFVLTPLPATDSRMQAMLVELVQPTSPGEVYRFQTSLFAGHRLLKHMGEDRIEEVEVVVSDEELDIEALSFPFPFPFELSPSRTEEIQLAAGIVCSISVQATTVRAQVVLPPSVARFREHLLFTTLLDGESSWRPTESLCSTPISGRSWIGPGQELFYRACDGNGEDRLTDGVHGASQEIYFPAGDQKTTSSTEDLQIRCPS